MPDAIARIEEDEDDEVPGLASDANVGGARHIDQVSEVDSEDDEDSADGDLQAEQDQQGQGIGGGYHEQMSEEESENEEDSVKQAGYSTADTEANLERAIGKGEEE